MEVRHTKTRSRYKAADPNGTTDLAAVIVFVPRELRQAFKTAAYGQNSSVKDTLTFLMESFVEQHARAA